MVSELLSRCCLRCPLFAFAPDADDWVFDYRCDGGSIRKQNPGITNQRRNVAYPARPCHVLFVGDAPGADEDRLGIPFIGKAGKLLRKAIAKVYQGSSWVRGLTNVCRCRPPRNWAPMVPTDPETAACLPRLLREIEIRKPRLLVALGPTPLKVLCGRSKILSLNGTTLPCILPNATDVLVTACVHPSYVLRNPSALPDFTKAIARSRECLVDRRSTKTKE
jgi:DNA polymerase